MPELKPLAALCFHAERLGRDLSALIAPPYDVLDQDDKDSLLGRSRHNIVQVDLPHVPPKSAGPSEAYDRAASTLAGWIREGVLRRDEHPAIYAYHQQFTHGGREFTRRMFVARLRLRPFEDGVILPHERTFGGPKEDRLALMTATKCQLSPIFGLYTDPERRIDSVIEPATRGQPDMAATLDGVENRVWRLVGPRAIEQISGIMTGKRIYIADGHHRYGTALLYRDRLAEQAGRLPDDHPANYVMFVLCSMDDPGCLILPYHRAIESINLDALLDAWRDGVEVVGGTAGTSATPSPPPFDPRLGEGGRARGVGDLLLHEGVTGLEVPLRYRNRDILASLEPNEPLPWRELDYAYLHRYLIEELLAGYYARAARGARAPAANGAGGSPEGDRYTSGGARLESPRIHYLKSAEDAVRVACQTEGVALLTNATPMAHLRAVSEAGGLMPQKSTYFHPKLATGLTMYPLA